MGRKRILTDADRTKQREYQRRMRLDPERRKRMNRQALLSFCRYHHKSIFYFPAPSDFRMFEVVVLADGSGGEGDNGATGTQG